MYGNKESSNPNSEEWVYLGGLNQDPRREAVLDRWSYLTTHLDLAPEDVNELATKDPIYVDVELPPVDDMYRYLKVIVHDTFDSSKESGINYNQQEYFTLHELEVYVKKN